MEKPVRCHECGNPVVGTYVFTHGTGILIPLIKNNSSDFHVLGAALKALRSSPPHCWRLLLLEQHWKMWAKAQLCVSQSHQGLSVGTAKHPDTYPFPLARLL